MAKVKEYFLWTYNKAFAIPAPPRPVLTVDYITRNSGATAVQEMSTTLAQQMEATLEQLGEHNGRLNRDKVGHDIFFRCYESRLQCWG